MTIDPAEALPAWTSARFPWQRLYEVEVVEARPTEKRDQIRTDFPNSDPDLARRSPQRSAQSIQRAKYCTITAGHSGSRFLYLEVIMSAAIAVPEHKLSESPNSRSIEIGDWFITASTNPISNAPDCDALQAMLGFPLPEMTFGSNFLTLEHRPSALKYSFTTGDALKAVKKGELQEGDGGVKVEYADKWLQSR